MNDDIKQYLIGLAGKGPHVLLHTGARNHETADWMLQHVLVCADDRYLGLDIEGMDASRRALTKWGPKVSLLTCRTEHVMRQRLLPDEMHDGAITIAYLDGDRSKRSVETVAKLLWPLLRTGGVVVWNAYRTKRVRIPEVCIPVDAFLETHEHKVVLCGPKIIVKKLA